MGAVDTTNLTRLYEELMKGFDEAVLNRKRISDDVLRVEEESWGEANTDAGPMSSRDLHDEDQLSLVRKLFLKRQSIQKELKRVEREIFKYETLLLETAQGTPVTKTLEYYSSNRSEKKKYSVRDSERIFSKDLPPINK
ncbi:UNVERIFIED_CONTAM: hypothetical protein PYX00_011312 [Menopon gallinae]|uniref:Chromatin modification-related protein MEAF6 n=1 Tax=Menopon gallinae TaxID=328185 RepID=A0AAW2H761_9NEOP